MARVARGLHGSMDRWMNGTPSAAMMRSRLRALPSTMADVIDPVTRSAEVVIRLDNKDRALPAGLFARVTFPGVSGEADGEEGLPKGPHGSAPNEGGR